MAITFIIADFADRNVRLATGEEAASAPAIILELSAVVSVRALGLMQPYWFKSYIVWTYSL